MLRASWRMCSPVPVILSTAPRIPRNGRPTVAVTNFVAFTGQSNGVWGGRRPSTAALSFLAMFKIPNLRLHILAPFAFFRGFSRLPF